MVLRWRSCPHCHGCFEPRQENKEETHCPKCKKALAAATRETKSNKWYHLRDNQPVGPLTSAQLKELAAAGTLSSTDMVLRAGTDRWIIASNLKGLFPAAPAAPVAPLAPIPTALSSAKMASECFSRHEMLAEALVVPEPGRCVQCGICSYNCPMGIDVRGHAWRGKPVHDSHCLTCSECVKRCPRGVLRFERIPLFTVK